LFESADGKYLTLAALETPFWRRLVKALELTEFAGSELDEYRARFERTAEISAALRECFRSRPLVHWVGILAQHDVPFSTVPDISEVIADPHFRARDLFVDDKGATFVRFPVPMAGMARTSHTVPAAGEHADSILRDFGFGALEVEQLRAHGIV
jgi:CoA:oxalate CoA-transferase